MTIHLSRTAGRLRSLLGKWSAQLSGLLDHFTKMPPMKPLLVMSRRQKLAAAVDAAKRVKQGSHR